MALERPHLLVYLRKREEGSGYSGMWHEPAGFLLLVVVCGDEGEKLVLPIIMPPPPREGSLNGTIRGETLSPLVSCLREGSLCRIPCSDRLWGLLPSGAKCITLALAPGLTVKAECWGSWVNSSKALLITAVCKEHPHVDHFILTVYY